MSTGCDDFSIEWYVNLPITIVYYVKRPDCMVMLNHPVRLTEEYPLARKVEAHVISAMRRFHGHHIFDDITARTVIEQIAERAFPNAKIQIIFDNIHFNV